MLSRIMDWVGGAVVGAIIVGLANTIVGSFQKLEPLYTFLVWFIITFIVIIVINRVQEYRLKKRLNIDRERWNKIREEKIRLRQPYEDRLNVSKLLTNMNERALVFTREQLNTNIPERTWEQISKDVGKIIPKHLIFIMLILPRFQTFAKTKIATRFLTLFLLDITGIFNKYGYGALEAEKDKEYSKELKQVRAYEIGLPAKICEAIESSIIVSKMFSTLQLFDTSQPAFRQIEIKPAYANKVQYLLPTIQVMSSKAIGNIHESIERWITGG